MRKKLRRFVAGLLCGIIIVPVRFIVADKMRV